MDWDLWSSSYDQVAVVEDGNCSEHTGWQCDFYFGCGYGYDVIEEDALNEKYCTEVLRILIRKEDTEIEELGKELLSLQNELTCAEHERWPELCFSGLSEKSNWLDVSIRTLQNHRADDNGTRRLVHDKTDESLHEIMKDLQRGYSREAHGQDLRAKDCTRGPDLRTVSCASGQSDGMKLSDTSNLQVSGIEEDRSQLVTKDTGQTVNSSFSKDMENATKEAEIMQEGNAVVEYDSTYASRVAAGIRGREKRLGSMLSDSQQSKSGNYGNSDLDQKICDFSSESEGKVCTKELIVLDEDLDCLKPLQVVYPQQMHLPDNGESSSLKGDDERIAPQAMNIRNASLIPAKLQTKIIPYSRSRLKDEQKSQAHGCKSETYANLSKSNMSLPSKQKTQWKWKPGLDAFSDREPSDSPVKLTLKAPTNLTSWGQQKPSPSIISIEKSRSNKPLVRKITEREVQPSQHEAGEYALVPYDSKFSELQKKRKVDAQTSSVLQPDKLKDLKLNDLRTIAKQHNVKRYYKLNKGVLIELLKEQLGSC